MAATDLPVIAIGDVRVDDVPDLARTGIAGVAMVREIGDATDPGAVVRAALRAWEAASA